MNLKTYRAETMAEALAQVKRDLGGGAVILHTRSYKQGGVMGIGAKTVVEISAADGREVARKRRARESSPRRARTALPTLRPMVPKAPPPEPAAGDLIRRTYAAAKAELAQQQPCGGRPRRTRALRRAGSRPGWMPALPASPCGNRLSWLGPESGRASSSPALVADNPRERRGC